MISEAQRITQRIARGAGAILREGYHRAGPLRIEYKGAIDLVTELDRRSEDFIVGELRREFPGHAIYAEESGRIGEASEYEWLVDPLDGTTNFAHGLPLFAVSLALTRHGQLQLGVVYDPTRDELFSAEAGQGATLNDQPLQVSSVAELDKALLVTGFPYDVRTRADNNFAQFFQFQMRSQAVRRIGSAALDCCYVAGGRLDGYWEYRMKPWDIGAGVLIAAEAGGQVTTADGAEAVLGRDSIVVSNGHLHAQMLQVLREIDPASAQH